MIENRWNEDDGDDVAQLAAELVAKLELRLAAECELDRIDEARA